MKKTFFFTLFLVSLFGFSQTKYKCMLQMSSYSGEPAYIVVSLINPNGVYEKTLQVMGDNKKWYKSLESWFTFYKKGSQNIDAITGASITSGDRRIIDLSLDEAKFDKGYKIRFESAVEDENYYQVDIEVPLTQKNIASKTQGNGYIQFVKFNKLQ